MIFNEIKKIREMEIKTHEDCINIIKHIKNTKYNEDFYWIDEHENEIDETLMMNIKQIYINILLFDSTVYKSNKEHILSAILSIRPFTKTEYKSFLNSYPNHKEFVNDALGITQENAFNDYFQDITNTNIRLELSCYIGDIYNTLRKT